MKALLQECILCYEKEKQHQQSFIPPPNTPNANRRVDSVIFPIIGIFSSKIKTARKSMRSLRLFCCQAVALPRVPKPQSGLKLPLFARKKGNPLSTRRCLMVGVNGL